MRVLRSEALGQIEDAQRDLGPLDVRQTLRVALWGFTLMVVGAQVVFGSFFLGLLGLSGETREGRA